MAKILVDDDLVEQVKKKHPELTRLNATDVADWAMRRSLKENV